MKHKIRDSIIFLIDALGISFLYRAYIRTKGPLVRVICFHDVQNREWFEGAIELLSREFRVITPEQFRSQDFDPEKINILITFDDGYQSWIDNCLPVLDAHGFKAIFFITSGLLDSAKEGTSDVFMRERLLITPKEPLTWEGARKLLESGHEIGGHTRTHADLGKLPPKEARIEIVSDKERIESELGVATVSFAYPFGRKKHFTNATNLMALDIGYLMIFSAETGFPTDGELPVPRTLIEKDQPLKIFCTWLKGGYDILHL